LSRNDYFGDWQTPPSYPYGLLQRDVIIAALGATVALRRQRSHVRIVSGAPLRNTLLMPKLAVLPMQAAELHPLTARSHNLNVLR